MVTPPPIIMKAGTVIDYRLKLRGIPMRWRSEIARWEPPELFVDEQRRGPYLFWRHLHTFAESGSGTIARDYVEYAVIGGSIVRNLLVAPDLRRIFSYRQEKLLELFPQ